jgi:hypothetical protein
MQVLHQAGVIFAGATFENSFGFALKLTAAP